MPSYVQAKMENIGELFLNCGTKNVAGRSSNLQAGAGENFSLVTTYNWHMTPNHSASLENVSSIMSLVLPIYGPLVSSVLNAVNQKDKVQKLVLNDVDRAPTGGNNKILGTYTAEDGRITEASLDKDANTITIMFEFEKITYDDKVANTSGNVKTTDAG